MRLYKRATRAIRAFRLETLQCAVFSNAAPSPNLNLLTDFREELTKEASFDASEGTRYRA